jgi:hypothetical protein
MKKASAPVIVDRDWTLAPSAVADDALSEFVPRLTRRLAARRCPILTNTKDDCEASTPSKGRAPL